LVVAFTLGVSLVAIRFAAAAQGGFEIDADQTTASHALYSGNDSNGTGDDWAAGGSGSGVFELSSATPHTAAADCYNSNIDKTSIGGVSAFICDGNTDNKFSGKKGSLANEPEENSVSPSGKSQDDIWPIKAAGVGAAKDDFSHAYVYARSVDSPCTPGNTATDTMLVLAGHVGDNEGDHFWGFEFDKNKPGNFDLLKSGNTGSGFNLDYNRVEGDLVVSFSVPGNTSDPVLLEIYQISGFNADGSAQFTLVGGTALPKVNPNCPNAQPIGLSKLATNDFNDVQAPPWNIPACDPTATNSHNTCRLVSGAAADNLIPSRDFAEATVDLAAFNISPCFTNAIFSSRSSHPLTGADIKDVGGADFPLCGGKTGTKFEDQNGNGAKDAGEPGLSGWTMNLYKDAGTIGTLDAADDNDSNTPGIQPFQTATTGVGGPYSFSALQNGTYLVCEVLQSGWTQSVPNANTTLPAGETLADCSADSTLGPKGYAFTSGGGTDKTGNDFGNYQKATIGGLKFKDADADGNDKEADESGLEGWTIHVYDDSGGTAGSLDATDALVDTQTTASSTGTYTTKALAPGTYFVCESTSGQTGWVQTYPKAATAGSTSCSAKDGGQGWKVTITSGTNVTVQNFGNTPQSKIKITFLPQAKLPDGTTDATKATSISCTDTSNASVGSNTNNNELTTNAVLNNQSSVTCVITYTDP